MSLIMLHCPHCLDERLFEPPHRPASCPDRADSADGGCPERACVECGTGFFFGLAVPLRPGPLRAGPVRAGRRRAVGRGIPERAA